MNVVALVLSSLGILAAAAALHTALRQANRSSRVPYLEDRVSELSAAVQQLSDTPELNLEPFTALLSSFAEDLDQFQKDLEEGLDVARRRELRVRSAVQRGISRMEESGDLDPNFEAVVEEVYGRDGGGGQEEGLQHVRNDVGPSPSMDFPSGVPGLNAGELEQLKRRIYGSP